MTQYIEDLFNITLEPMAVTWSNYKERYQILSATGSLPDVFATLTLSSNDNNDSATFSDFINTGVIRALPEDLTDYPRLNEVLNSVSYPRYTNGKYYAIPVFPFWIQFLVLQMLLCWFAGTGWIALGFPIRKAFRILQT
ncbi:MAG: hypothetical protein ACLTUL_09405 [Blautia faecis]